MSVTRQPNTITAGFYKTLRPWQTRVIELHPDSDSSPLKCDVHLAEVVASDGLGLPEATPWRFQHYEALSYSWGRPDLTASISCNSEIVHIPPVMAEALLALRFPDRPRWLWCDAICINQTDDAEKSAQVQMIQAIFHKADRVVAWMGSDDAVNAQAFDLLLPLWSSVGGELAGKPEFRDLPEKDVQILQQFTQQSWFQRTWIRAEVFAAQDLVLQAGLRTVPLTLLEFILTTLKRNHSFPQRLDVLLGHYGSRYEPPTLAELDYHWQTNDRAYMMAHRVWPGQEFCNNFVATINSGKSFGASDDRDRIYALLGVINNNPSRFHRGGLQLMDLPPLCVDYGRSLGEVYQDVVKYLIKSSRSLSCIEVIRYGYNPSASLPFQRMDNMPSWAVDWRTDGPPIYRWWDDYREDYEARPNDDPQGTLILDGRLLGTVSSLMPGDVPVRRIAGENKHFLEPVLESGEYVCRFFNPTSSQSLSCWKGAGVIVPARCEIGDSLVLFRGAAALFALRLVSTVPARYSLVGVCGLWAFTSNPELNKGSIVVESNCQYSWWVGDCIRTGLYYAERLNHTLEMCKDQRQDKQDLTSEPPVSMLQHMQSMSVQTNRRNEVTLAPLHQYLLV